MGIGSDTDIEGWRRHGWLDVTPWDPARLQPASVDLTLSWARPLAFESAFPGEVIDPRKNNSGRMAAMTLDVGLNAYLMPARSFALVSTVEKVTFSRHIAGRLEGKSSLARLGLFVHVTAGFFDPGFTGYPTLELVNITDRTWLLVPGMPIGQMAFERCETPATVPYEGKYVDQGPVPTRSMYHRNFEGDTSGR